MRHDGTDIVVHVSRTELLTALEKNKGEHRVIFEQAMEGYKKKAIEILTTNLDNIKNDKLERLLINLTLPEDHTRDYERVIMMLQMHQNDFIDLSQEQFAQYVMDDWGWQHQFLESGTYYGSAAAVEKRRFSSYS